MCMIVAGDRTTGRQRWVSTNSALGKVDCGGGRRILVPYRLEAELRGAEIRHVASHSRRRAPELRVRLTTSPPPTSGDRRKHGG
jgi:hypothetical protein